MQIDSIAPNARLIVSPPAIQSGEGIGLPLPQADTLTGVEGTGKSFGSFLQEALSEVNNAQMRAGEITNRFAAGENVDIHQVMIAGQEAGVMLNLAVQVRNKLVEAYQEVMRVNL